MLFPEVSPPRDEILQLLATALRSDSGRVYLDASLLIHCYEMSAAARDELMGALEAFGERVRVPLWAAKETWEYVNERAIRRPLETHAAQTQRYIDRFRLEARRHVDDETVRDLSKAEFESQLDEAARAFIKLANLISKHEAKIDVTTARLMPFIESKRLNSDLNPILKTMAETARSRFSHGIPPGCADGGKHDSFSSETSERKAKGKKRNRYGDLIIWLEILQDCAKQETEHLVVVTRDITKGDWAYRPKKLLDEYGRPQTNAALVTLPQPLLVHEAMRACPSLKGVHVVSIEMLAHVLFSVLKSPIPSLVAALQTDDRDIVGRARTQVPDERATLDSDAEATKHPSVPVTFTSRDMSYDFPQADEIDDFIRALGLEGWRVQNKAVQQLELRLSSATRDQLVQIGRGAVNALNGGAVEPLEFVRRVFANDATRTELKGHILVGVLAQIYIAEDGEPKKPVATRELSELIYSFGGDSSFQQVYDAVIGRLVPQRRAYLALPGEPAAPIAVDLVLERTVLRGVRAFSRPLLEEQAPASRVINRLGRQASYSIAELLEELAREFVIPASRFKTELAASFQLQIPEYVGFVPWGPNTGTTLR